MRVALVQKKAKKIRVDTLCHTWYNISTTKYYTIDKGASPYGYILSCHEKKVKTEKLSTKKSPFKDQELQTLSK